ncbi:MAG TPA: ester cyclase [Steroidobacteraceae bacterium]|nr:ester cyclase [Steroidobacteraceae bacterium]
MGRSRRILLLACLLALAACETSSSRKQVVRSYIDDLLLGEHWNRWDEYMAKEPTYNGSSLGQPTFQAVSRFLHTTFTDVHVSIEDQHADGAWVTTRITLTGVHTGRFLNVMPSNRPVKFRAILLDRIEGGHVVEMWHQLDYWDALLQAARR